METRNNKILIISNAAFSLKDSNGRNLARLLDCFPKEQKAQFFVYGEPDFNECLDYYQVSDKDALSSFLRREKKNGSKSACSTVITPTTAHRRKKTPFRMLLREFVWRHGAWKNKYLHEWIDRVNPTVVLVVAGDNWFTLDLARSISIKKRIPIILYSTEEYPFKNYNYITKRPSLFYLFWRMKLLRGYKNIERFVKRGVFNSQDLADSYSSTYRYRCCALFQFSDIDWVANEEVVQKPTVSYLGNLGLDRHKALIEVAEALMNISPDLTLDIYGRVTPEIKKDLERCKNIRLFGFVTYERVVQVMHSSSLLVHAEHNDPFYNRDLKYAFSTKISDSISCGTPFMIYAPKCLVETSFLVKNKCAFVATSKETLIDVLKKGIYDLEERRRVLQSAKMIRESLFVNKGAMKEIVWECLND